MNFLLVSSFVLKDRVSYSIDCPQNHYVTEDNLDLLILLPPLPSTGITGVNCHTWLYYSFLKLGILHKNLKLKISKFLQFIQNTFWWMFNQIEYIKGTRITNVRFLGRWQISDFQVSSTMIESLQLSGVDMNISADSIKCVIICQHGTVFWLASHPLWGDWNEHTVKLFVVSFFTFLLPRITVLQVLVHRLQGGE